MPIASSKNRRQRLWPDKPTLGVSKERATDEEPDAIQKIKWALTGGETERSTA